MDLSTEDDERKTLLELVLGQREIILPNGPNCRLGRRLIFLFSKEHDEMLRGNLVSAVSFISKSMNFELILKVKF